MARASTPAEEPTNAVVVTQSGEEYTTRGQTRLATRHGHEFRPSDLSIPTITSDGVNVTAEQAEALLKESKTVGGTVYQVKED